MITRRLLFVATLALWVGAGCVPSEGLTRCASGIVCPEGKVCTEDGNECIEADARCGDGIVQAALGEDCDCGDPENLSPECLAPNSDSAAAECRTDCVLHCGDGEINEPEQCEGTPDNTSCIDFGFQAGATSCSSCFLDFSGCRNIGFLPLVAEESTNILDAWAGDNGVFFGIANGFEDTESRLVSSDGVRWTTWAPRGMASVWGFANDDVFAAGAGGVWHFDGSAWSLMLDLDVTFSVVHGNDRTSLWAVGATNSSPSEGIAYRFDGEQWTAVSPPADTANLRDLTVDSQGRAWVASVSTIGLPQLWRYEAGWIDVAGGPIDLGFLSATHDGRVLAVMSDMLVDISEPGCLPDTCPVVFSSPSTIYNPVTTARGETFIAAHQEVFYNDGTGWSQSQLLTGSAFAAVWPAPSGDVFVGGGINVAMGSFDGHSSRSTGWFRGQLLTPDESVRSVWTGPGEDLWIASNSGVFKREGQDLVDTQLGQGAGLLAGSSADNLFAISSGDLSRRQGDSWSSFAPASGINVASVWSSAPDDVIFGDQAGGIHVWDGQELTSYPSVSVPMGMTLTAISQVRGNRVDGYVARGGADVFRLIDGSWQRDEIPRVNGIGGPPSGPTYAVGPDGLILQLVDGEWRQIPTQLGVNFRSVHGSGPDDIWAVGPSTLGLHFDGIQWSPVLTSRDAVASQTVFATQSTVYFVQESRLRMIHRRGPQ